MSQYKISLKNLIYECTWPNCQKVNRKVTTLAWDEWESVCVVILLVTIFPNIFLSFRSMSSANLLLLLLLLTFNLSFFYYRLGKIHMMWGSRRNSWISNCWWCFDWYTYKYDSTFIVVLHVSKSSAQGPRESSPHPKIPSSWKFIQWNQYTIYSLKS